MHAGAPKARRGLDFHILQDDVHGFIQMLANRCEDFRLVTHLYGLQEFFVLDDGAVIAALFRKRLDIQGNEKMHKCTEQAVECIAF